MLAVGCRISYRKAVEKIVGHHVQQVHFDSRKDRMLGSSPKKLFLSTDAIS